MNACPACIFLGRNEPLRSQTRGHNTESTCTMGDAELAQVCETYAVQKMLS